MIRRIRAGHSPFAADRQHLHHLLLGSGLSDRRTTAVLLLMALMTGAAGVAAYGLNAPVHLQFYAFLALFGLYYQATTRLWKRQRSAGSPTAAHALNRRAASSAKSLVAPAAFRPEPLQNEK